MSVSKLAIVGSRGHYRTVLDELETLPSLRVVGLCDGGDTAAPLAAWCRAHGHTPSSFDDYRAMLDHARPDMLVVCGPFERHAEMCVRAIDAGVHVLTEKPAALSFGELDSLRDCCRRHPGVHLAGMMFSRYSPGFFTAKQLIASGAIGDVRLMNARKSYKLGTRDAYYHDRRTYGGTIPWVGSHAIDWLMWLGGGTFQSVYATHSTAHNGGNGTMEATASCLFALSGGRSATVSIDYLRPATAPTHGDDWIRVVGSDGVLEARQDAVTLINGDHDRSSPVPVACDRRPLADFLSHVEGRGRALIDAAATIALTDACLRARQSADEGRVVAF